MLRLTTGSGSKYIVMMYIYIYIYTYYDMYIYILLLKKSRKVPCWFLLEISKYWAGNHMFKVVAYSLFFFGLFVGESGHGS